MPRHWRHDHDTKDFMERDQINEAEHKQRMAAWNQFFVPRKAPERVFDLGAGEVFQRREEGWFLCLNGKAQREATKYEATLLSALLD